MDLILDQLHEMMEQEKIPEVAIQAKVMQRIEKTGKFSFLARKFRLALVFAVIILVLGSVLHLTMLLNQGLQYFLARASADNLLVKIVKAVHLDYLSAMISDFDLIGQVIGLAQMTFNFIMDLFKNLYFFILDLLS